MITIYDPTDARFQSQSLFNSASLTNVPYTDDTFYELLPVNTSPPIITNDIALSFIQHTHSQTINHDDRVFRMLEGTSFQIQVLAIDPSYINNTDLFVYKWYRNKNTILEGIGYDYSILFFDTSDCVSSISGEYYCEVTSQFGTVTSDVIIIEVYDLSKNLLIGNNLILNPNGGQGISNWDLIDQDFTVQNYYPGSYKWVKNHTTNQINSNINPNFLFFDGVVDSAESDLHRSIDVNIIPNSPNSTGSYVNFFPSPQHVDSVNNIPNSLSNQIINSSSLYYFTRAPLEFSNAGGNRICSAKQTIDIINGSNLIRGNVYGVTHLSMVLFAYFGGGISYYDSLHPLGVMEDTTRISIDFFDINQSLIPSPYGIDVDRPDILHGPTICDLYDVTNNFTSFKGVSAIFGKRVVLPYIPPNAAYVDVRLTFEHTGIQQDLQNAEIYNWDSSNLPLDSRALGEAILADNNPSQIFRSMRYGNARSLITGIHVALFPNDDAQTSMLLSSPSTVSNVNTTVN